MIACNVFLGRELESIGRNVGAFFVPNFHITNV